MTKRNYDQFFAQSEALAKEKEIILAEYNAELTTLKARKRIITIIMEMVENGKYTESYRFSEEEVTEARSYLASKGGSITQDKYMKEYYRISLIEKK